MNTKYAKLLPDWYLHEQGLDMVLSNDFDSLLSCSILKKQKKWKIKYFWDFETLYIDKSIAQKPEKGNNRVWVDGSVMIPEKSFDNHLSQSEELTRVNPQTINPNQLMGIRNERYREKYSGSTALMIWSLYNLPLPASERGKMILLAVDSCFLGFYNDDFREWHEFYLSQVFGFPELLEVERRHTKQDFDNLIKELRLKSHIEYMNGELKTALKLKEISKELNIEINLPCLDLEKIGTFKIVRANLNTRIKEFIEKQKNLFSLVFTKKDYLMVSFIQEDYTRKQRYSDERQQTCISL